MQAKKILYIKPNEFKWINNILNVSKSDPTILWEQNRKSVNEIINTYPEIKEDNHTYFSFWWSIDKANDIVKYDMVIEKSDFGLSYNTFLRDIPCCRE